MVPEADSYATIPTALQQSSSSVPRFFILMLPDVLMFSNLPFFEFSTSPAAFPPPVILISTDMLRFLKVAPSVFPNSATSATYLAAVYLYVIL